mgnify:CR=1 FL=1
MALVAPAFDCLAQGRKSKLVTKDKCMPGETVSVEDWNKHSHWKWPSSRAELTGSHVAEWLALFFKKRLAELRSWTGMGWIARLRGQEQRGAEGRRGISIAMSSSS